MLNKSTNYVNLISILILVYLAFIPFKPNNIELDSVIENGFSIQNSMNHVKQISQQPHYFGSSNHSKVKKYIIRKLQDLGLTVRIQKTNSVNDSRSFAHVENILAKIKGSDKNAKSLVVMSHYDSVAFASKGASDAGSGVAVILEGMRAFLAENTQPKNDIILLITDAEEPGLLGAKAFVNKHEWAKNVGAVINFEARGSSGASFMIMETNHGNHQLFETYNNADIQFPSSNSLAYSIYKLLPNDTDLSAFRKDKDIVGYNFAFIGSHFNYHTELDNYQNLSLDSLAHQAHYIMPMLRTLSQIDLSTLTSEQDDVYFQVPFYQTISYPFDWALNLTFANFMLFFIAIAIGLKNKSMRLKPMLLGALPLIKSLIVSALVSFALLKFLYWLHPHYSEILQGFTYNGKVYIYFFSLLSISICYYFYRNSFNKLNATEQMVFPIFVWLLIGSFFAVSLKGAHFFTLISLLASVSLLIQVSFKKPFPSLNLLILAPVFLIFSPFFELLPIALGLMSIPFVTLLLILICALIMPSIQVKGQVMINRWVFIVPLLGLSLLAETQASFNQQRPLPDSLYYFQNQQTKQAHWISLDNQTDTWTQPFFEENRLAKGDLKSFQDSNWPWAKIAATTEYKNLEVAKIEVLKDRKYSDKRIYQIKITPNQHVYRLKLINNKKINLLKLAVDNEIIQSGSNNPIKPKRSIVKIYKSTQSSFLIDIETAPEDQLDLSLLEISPNLLTSHAFDIPPRPKQFIPKPFVFADSIITKQDIVFDLKQKPQLPNDD